MNLKKSRIIAGVCTFVFSFICHFAYQLVPNFIFSILFPVNESIFEHMKILYSSIILYSFIDLFVLKKKGVDFNNFWLAVFIMSFSSIFIYLMLFLPIFYKIGENMFIAIMLMVLVYIVVYIIGYFILSSKEKNFKFFWIFLLILGYVVFGILTYNPMKNDLFFDTIKEDYGIIKENN